MGRLALVDFSLIKEICVNLKTSKNKFKGQLELNPENESTKTGKKTEEIKRLLVSGAKKKSGSPSKKRRKKSPARKSSPVRFRQNPSKAEESSSSSESSESSSEAESDRENKFSDDLSDIDSDINSDTLGEAEWII